LEDPVSTDEVGVFTDPVLQELYNQLIIQGNQSLSDALKVGATIEEIDILDLETRLEQTDKPDIQRVYGNLLNGSMNHLRAFVSTLQRQTGEDYSSQYLSQDAFDAIIDGGMQGGEPGGQGMGVGGNGNQTSRGNGRGG
jgi:rubrerythrin